MHRPAYCSGDPVAVSVRPRGPLRAVLVTASVRMDMVRVLVAQRAQCPWLAVMEGVGVATSGRGVGVGRGAWFVGWVLGAVGVGCMPGSAAW